MPHHLSIISIHAPPRGATMCREVRAPRPCHFNSRPSARGDGKPQKTRKRHAHFNSRPSARGDVIRQALEVMRGNISIHAPPRGATTAPQPHGRTADRFQFTPLREGRLRGVRESGRRENFNSRPSARGDFRRLHRRSPLQKYFNSRPSARGDSVWLWLE